mgnify:CR=1 FL=1
MFIIDHQKRDKKKLKYISLSGPENGVYYRGKLKGSKTIQLPEEWEWLVDPTTVTVNLTPVGSPQLLFVKGIQGREIVIESHTVLPINCHFTVYGERADVPKAVVVN